MSLRIESRRRLLALSLALVSLSIGRVSSADTTPQSLPFTQNWSQPGLITLANDWSGVPGIIGIRGDDLTLATGTDPQTILTESAVLNVIANQADPNSQTAGGVAEFDGIANPTIAIQGSGTADAPYVLLSLNTTGAAVVRVRYNLRDLDSTPDNAVQAVALQYRVGTTGNFVNVPGGFVADATTQSLATLETAVDVVLPAEAGNQPLLQVRILTTNAVGSDEWVGVDDIMIASVTAPTVSGFASPDVLPAGDPTTLFATVVPGQNPASTGLTVTCDLSPIGGLAGQALFDDGTHGDQVVGDNLFTLETSVAIATTPGTKQLALHVSDAQTRSSDGTIKITVTDPLGVPRGGASAALVVHPAVPNPFRVATSIEYELAEASTVTAAVHDLQGRVVALLRAGASSPAGRHRVEWSGLDAAGRRVAPGVYLLRIQTERGAAIRRLLAID